MDFNLHAEPGVNPSDTDYAPLLRRLDEGEWRTQIFAEILCAEGRKLGPQPTFLEIGCGLGFDGDARLQREIANVAGRVIGVEPDRLVQPQHIFAELHRTILEMAPIEPASVDLAYSVMVMEHVPDPTEFLRAVHRALRPGGVYWGFTVDRRHWFSIASSLASRLGIKTTYLRWLNRNIEGETYLDYPTYYRLNRPASFPAELGFTKVFTRSYGSVHAVAEYAPPVFRPLVRKIEEFRLARGGVRTGFLVRLEK